MKKTGLVAVMIIIFLLPMLASDEDDLLPIPDATVAAVSEQATAQTEAKAKPTPGATGEYPGLEEVGFTQLVDMDGGEFIQTDGKNSFYNTLSPFKISRYAVTKDLWHAVKKWGEKNGYELKAAGRDKELKKLSPEPAGGINRRDAIVWCNAYSQMMQLKPVYYSDKEFKKPIKSSLSGDFEDRQDLRPGSFDSPYVDWTAGGYRLPTEGEWLYAVTYINGGEWLHPDAYSNTPRDSKVVYEAGKLSEWVWDFYGEYPVAAQKDYRGPELKGTETKMENVMHGGKTTTSSRSSTTYNVSVGQRIARYPAAAEGHYGFRVVRPGLKGE